MASSFRTDNSILTGSLTEVSVGLPYLNPGQNIAITTAANGQITIAGTSGADIEGVTAGTGLSGGGTSGTVTLTTNDNQIVHDDLSGFVANEHINHSTVSINTGTGLTGGGDLTTTRTISIDTSVVPQKNADNSFSGNNTFGGTLLAPKYFNIRYANLYVTGSSYFKGDMVVSGSLYTGDARKTFTRETLKGYLLVGGGSGGTNDSTKNELFINVNGGETIKTVTPDQDEVFVVPSSGYVNSVFINTANSGKFSGVGYLTASFYTGNFGTITSINAAEETVIIQVPSQQQHEINFQNAYFNKGEVVAISLKPDEIWNTVGTSSTVFSIALSYFND